jgi:hypothetical protein
MYIGFAYVGARKLVELMVTAPDPPICRPPAPVRRAPLLPVVPPVPPLNDIPPEKLVPPEKLDPPPENDDPPPLNELPPENDPPEKLDPPPENDDPPPLKLDPPPLVPVPPNPVWASASADRPRPRAAATKKVIRRMGGTPRIGAYYYNPATGPGVTADIYTSAGRVVRVD